MKIIYIIMWITIFISNLVEIIGLMKRKKELDTCMIEMKLKFKLLHLMIVLCFILIIFFLIISFNSGDYYKIIIGIVTISKLIELYIRSMFKEGIYENGILTKTQVVLKENIVKSEFKDGNNKNKEVEIFYNTVNIFNKEKEESLCIKLENREYNKVKNVVRNYQET